MSITPARPRRALFARVAAGIALSGGLVAGMTVPAQAAVPRTGDAVVQLAESLVGTPYRAGGATPAGFDCSGFTQYVLGEAGVAMPRTADGQLKASHHIAKADARPGDLVFFTSGGRAYHAAVYAGNGRIYDSPKPGKAVSQRAIWSSAVVYARVL